MNIKHQLQGFDISDRSAAIIGCGGLGTNIGVHLAGAGVGCLVLCDFDTVEERNLNRQFFYTRDDIGKLKCELLAKKLSSYAPDCKIKSVSNKIESAQDLLPFADCDIIILAVDNIETRKTVNDFCVQNKLPCINGSINGFFGTAYLFVPGITPDLQYAGALEMPKAKPLSPSMTAGIIGALESKLAVDYFIQNKESQGMLLCYDGTEVTALKIRGEIYE